MTLSPELERILDRCRSAGIGAKDGAILRKALEVRTVRITKREYRAIVILRVQKMADELTKKPIGGAKDGMDRKSD